MGTLYLVRHGQASFGADDYDQLSPLGLQQAQRLGAHWLAHGQRFDTVLMGTLRLKQAAGTLSMDDVVAVDSLLSR